MEYKKVILSNKNKLEVKEVIHKITSQGIFILQFAERKNIVPVNVKNFSKNKNEVWKEKECVLAWKKPPFYMEKGKPKPVIRVIENEKFSSSVIFFYTGDVFYICSEKEIRVQSFRKAPSGKYELVRIKVLSKKPGYSQRSLKLFEKSEEYREEELFHLL